MKPPVIVAGEPEFHGWCAVCGTPTRVRVPLYLGSNPEPVSHLEICPGCGTGHDRPSVTVTKAPRERRRGHLLARLARTIHGRACRRKGLQSLACAHQRCQWPGLWRLQHEMPSDDGVYRFMFCSARHKRAWAAEHGVLLP